MEKRSSILSIFALVLFLWHAPVHAQTYPVQTHVVTSGPYFNYLSYYGDQNNHLQVIVTMLDFNLPPVMARLRIRIEGPGYELYTNPNALVGQPFLLEGGVPVNLSGIDLLPYLQQNNLIVSPQGLDINALPEGFTTVCVDVIKDGTAQEVLSTNNCTAFSLFKFQPPQTFLPQCATELDTTQMFYNFQWSPPIGYTPDLNSELLYTFSLYRWNDPSNYSIFTTDQGLVWRETDLTMAQTQVSDLDVAFELGGLYVWRVEAQITSNGMPVNMILNNGFSENCTFTFGQAQTLAEVLSDGLYIDLFAEPSAENKGKAYWVVIDNTPNVGLSTFDQFFVEYRKQPTGNEGFEIPWFSETVTDFDLFIYQLEPSTTYEVKVSGIVGGVVGDPTPVKNFTTPAARVYTCGESDLPFLPSTFTPLENATAGIQVQIGQFKMDVSELTPTGSTGHYEGKGTIPIAFLAGAKAKVTFEDILIDTEYKVREGRVDVITQGLENWLLEQYQQFIDPIYVNGTVDSAYVDSNGVAWVIVDGINQSFTFDPPTYPIIINDASGYQYTIYPNGTVVISIYLEVSEYWTVAPNEVVHFGQNENETRGFDGKEFMQWHEQYEVMQLSDSSFYFVANKSMAADEADVVNVQLSPSNGNVSFQFADGSPVTSAPLTGTWMGDAPHGSAQMKTLSIPARSAGEYQIHAIANNTKVGQLNVFVYGKKEKELVVVPLVSNFNLSDAQIEAELDATLGEANIAVEVTVAPQWNNTTFTASTTISLPTDVGLMNKYSDDMKALRDAYLEANPNADKTKFYLFVVAGFDDPNEMGYMVRGRSMGFIKGSQSNILETISHELGHGMGALEHSWKDNGPDETTTSNLMDYASANPAPTPKNNLTKAQWKELRDADFVPSLFDEVEDGSSVVLSASDIPDRLKNPNKTLSFFSGGDQYEIITLPPNTIDIVLSTSDPYVTWQGELSGSIAPVGSLIAFTLDNGTNIPDKYRAQLDEFGGIRYRLLDAQGDVVVTAEGNTSNPPVNNFDFEHSNNFDSLQLLSNAYIDPFSKALAAPKVIVGLPYYEANSIGYKLYGVEANTYSQPSKNSSHFGFNNSSPFFALSYAKGFNGVNAGLYDVNPELLDYLDWFKLKNGEAVNIKSLNGSDDLSPLAKGYLDKFSEFTKKDNILAPVLIAISEWVSRLETSEVYSNCTLDSDMPIVLAFFQPNSTSFNAPLNLNNDYTPLYLGAEMEGNSSQTLMSQNWVRQDEERLKLIAQFYNKFVNLFHGVIEGNGLAEDINADIQAANTVPQIVSTLRSYTLCDYELISFDNRMKCINLIKNSNAYADLVSFINPLGIISGWGEAWSAQEYNETLIVKLVTGTKYNGQSDAMSAELFNNNGALFWDFFNFTDGKEYHGFMNTLLELTMVYNQTTPAVTIDFGQFENNKILDRSYNEATNRFIFKLMQSNTQGLTYDLISSVHPETLITVDLTSDIKSANLSSFYEDYVGDKITVPAFYLHYMEEQRVNANLTKAVMVLLDLAVIVGSAGTATPYAIASIALAGSNIVVTLNEDAISQMNGGQDFLNVWSLVQIVDGVNGLTQLGVGIGKKISGSSLKLFFSLDNMSAGLAQVKTSSAYQDATTALEKVRRLWSFMQFSGEEVLANMMRSKMMMKLEEKVLKKNFVKVNPAADLEVLNLYNVKIEDATHSANILTMNPNSQGAFLTGNIVDEIPENSLVLARFDDVRFSTGSQNIQTGDLVVFKKTNGSFVVVREPLSFLEIVLNGKVIGKFTRGVNLEIIDDVTSLYGGNMIHLVNNKSTTITGVIDDVNVVANRGVNADGSLNGVTYCSPNIGGINILRSPQWGIIKAKYKSILDAGDVLGYWKKVTDEFWETVNKPWLDDAIARGDNFRFVSNPTSDEAIYVTNSNGFVLDAVGNRIKSIFGREIDYLKSKGYTILSNGTAAK